MRRLKRWALTLKQDVFALWLAARDPRTPWVAKAVAACVAGYASSPIDLIPDFIPILGYLDELILLPLGIALAVRLVPQEIMAEHRQTARTAKPRALTAALIIAIVWTIGAAFC